MKLTIEQAKLTALLDRVSKAVEKRQTIPILAHILLDANGDTLRATGTNLEVTITTTAEAGVIQPGRVTVSADLFAALVKRLRAGSTVELEAGDGILHVRSGRSNLNLSTLPVDDFPVTAASDYTVTLETEQSEIKRILDMTAFAMSTEETRYYLNGVYLHTVDGLVRGVSTDGHRLAQSVSGIGADIPGVILPAKTVALLRSLLDEGSATMALSETKALFDLGHTVVSGSVIDGKFPDYTRIIPRGNENKVTFNAADAKQAVGLVSLISQQKTRSVKLCVTSEEISFNVQDVVAGNGCEAIDATLEGVGVELGLNSKYALDCFALADKGDITVSYSDAMSPVLVTYDTQPDFLAVIMPMRIN